MSSSPRNQPREPRSISGISTDASFAVKRSSGFPHVVRMLDDMTVFAQATGACLLASDIDAW